MNVLFLSVSQAISDVSNRGIYPDLLRYFSNAGHRLYILFPTERRSWRKSISKTKDNITIVSIRIPNITKTSLIERGLATILINLLFKMAIIKNFRKVHFDLVLYSTPPITFNSIINYTKRKHHAGSYLLLKDIFPQNAVDLGLLAKTNPMYWYFRGLEKKLYSISDNIGCMSPANMSYLLEQNPELPVEKVEVCPNSVELPKDTKSIPAGPIRRKYGIPTDKTVFIYGGNLGKPQGIPFLIEVLRTNSGNPKAYFVIAGNGTEYSRLKKSIDKYQIGNVLLIPFMARDHYIELLKACDVGLIFLDHRFTIPNYPSRLLDYLACRKPVMMAIDQATDIGRTAEKNGYGLWVESRDVSCYNQKIKYLIDHPKQIRSMGEKGRRYLEKNFTVDLTYNRIMSHFDKDKAAA